MLLTLITFSKISIDIEKEEFLEIVDAFIKKNKKKYKKFLQQQKGVVS